MKSLKQLLADFRQLLALLTTTTDTLNRINETLNRLAENRAVEEIAKHTGYLAAAERHARETSSRRTEF